MTFESALCELPDGTFVAHGGYSALVKGARLFPWQADGYGHPVSLPRAQRVQVLTPCSTVGVLRAGNVPALHPSIQDAEIA